MMGSSISGPDLVADGRARSAMIGRMRKLERLGLAEPLGPAQWHLSEGAELTLRALGERTDIIKRIHRGLAEQHIELMVEPGGTTGLGLRLERQVGTHSQRDALSTRPGAVSLAASRSANRT